jgi:hypothetical protein
MQDLSVRSTFMMLLFDSNRLKPFALAEGIITRAHFKFYLIKKYYTALALKIKDNIIITIN